MCWRLYIYSGMDGEMFAPAGQVWNCSWIVLILSHNKRDLFLLCPGSKNSGTSDQQMMSIKRS